MVRPPIKLHNCFTCKEINSLNITLVALYVSFCLSRSLSRVAGGLLASCFHCQIGNRSTLVNLEVLSLFIIDLVIWSPVLYNLFDQSLAYK